MAKQAFEVLVGLNYATAKGEQRAEPGDVRDDLPAKSLPWLVAQGAIREIPAESTEE